MHNRDLTWCTSDGALINIKNMSSKQLVDILKYLNTLNEYELEYGPEASNWKFNIEQEIRYRKLKILEKQ